MPSSISRQAQSSSSPARFSSQYFQTSLPEPRICPRQLPRSIGPAGTKIAGRFALVAPITSAGTVLSQPPSSTTPSAGIRAQRFLGVHRQQVAIEHRARLHERLAEREHGDLHREAARLPDAALHVFRAQPEVRVARVGVAPGVEDGDDRLAGDVFGAEAGLLGARAMAERAEVVLAEPAMAAQIGRRLSGGSRVPQRARHRRELRDLLVVERRDEGRNRAGRGDARELGRLVQHARRAPGVAQVLERHEQRAQRLGARPVAGARGLEELLAARAARCSPSRWSCPARPKSRRWTTAGRSPMPLTTRARRRARSRPSRYGIVRRIVADDRVLDRDARCRRRRAGRRRRGRRPCRCRRRPPT